jgi:hypothetical protein
MRAPPPRQLSYGEPPSNDLAHSLSLFLSLSLSGGFLPWEHVEEAPRLLYLLRQATEDIGGQPGDYTRLLMLFGWS